MSLDDSATNPEPPPAPRGPAIARSNLFIQQAWISRLRWVAGITVVAGGLLEITNLLHDGHGAWMIGLGLIILTYNAIFVSISQRLGAQPMEPAARDSLYALVWTQIVADLVCLTMLTAWTGDYQSPVRALFVLHMVFASLLLNRVRAFGVALAAIGMVEATLLLTAGHSPTREQIAVGAGWDLTLLATVYLASRLALNLRLQRRRLLRQNRRIRVMSRHLHRQQQLMVQQDKMFALGQMAAGVAHEVANPLASMDGLLQLLERRPEKVTAENLARLREQIARITTIVRQLTDFSHAGGEWQDANLNNVITKALDVLRFDRRVKRIAIEKHLDPAIPLMRLQPAALEQVIINMVVNAADAMDTIEKPQLSVITARQGEEVRITIADNGTGIPSQIRDRIFEPFFTTKPVGKGTGLGLSISYSLIRKHEGHIDVRSSPTQGTTFDILLPLVALPAIPAPPPVSAAEKIPSQEREQPPATASNVGNSGPTKSIIDAP